MDSHILPQKYFTELSDTFGNSTRLQELLREEEEETDEVDNCRTLEMTLRLFCRARKMLQNEHLVAKFCFDTAENELSEVQTILAILMNW